MKCPNCGYRDRKPGSFCTDCGSSFSAQPLQPVPPPVQPANQQNNHSLLPINLPPSIWTGMIILLIIITVVVPKGINIITSAIVIAVALYLVKSSWVFLVWLWICTKSFVSSLSRSQKITWLVLIVIVALIGVSSGVIQHTITATPTARPGIARPTPTDTPIPTPTVVPPTSNFHPGIQKGVFIHDNPVLESANLTLNLYLNGNTIEGTCTITVIGGQPPLICGDGNIFNGSLIGNALTFHVSAMTFTGTVNNDGTITDGQFSYPTNNPATDCGTGTWTTGPSSS